MLAWFSISGIQVLNTYPDSGEKSDCEALWTKGCGLRKKLWSQIDFVGANVDATVIGRPLLTRKKSLHRRFRGSDHRSVSAHVVWPSSLLEARTALKSTLKSWSPTDVQEASAFYVGCNTLAERGPDIADLEKKMVNLATSVSHTSPQKQREITKNESLERQRAAFITLRSASPASKEEKRKEYHRMKQRRKRERAAHRLASLKHSGNRTMPKYLDIDGELTAGRQKWAQAAHQHALRKYSDPANPSIVQNDKLLQWKTVIDNERMDGTHCFNLDFWDFGFARVHLPSNSVGGGDGYTLL